MIERNLVFDKDGGNGNGEPVIPEPDLGVSANTYQEVVNVGTQMDFEPIADEFAAGAGVHIDPEEGITVLK